MMAFSEKKAALAKEAGNRMFPDGLPYKSLSIESVDKLSRAFGLSGREVEILALEEKIVPERYIRNMRHLSMDQQSVLLRSRICLVGLGGLGGYALEILARTGVGSLTLVDGDRFEDSNLNRQALSSPFLLDVPKARAAGKRVSEINPSLSITTHDTFLTEDNAAFLLDGANLAMDCLDNLKTRFVLEKAAKKLGIPMVSAAVAGISGHVTVIFPDDAGLELIYGKEKDSTAKGAEATLGCMAHAVAFLASLECSEAVKILLKQNQILRNKLLVVDLADNTCQVLDLH